MVIGGESENEGEEEIGGSRGQRGRMMESIRNGGKRKGKAPLTKRMRRKEGLE